MTAFAFLMTFLCGALTGLAGFFYLAYYLDGREKMKLGVVGQTVYEKDEEPFNLIVKSEAQ